VSLTPLNSFLPVSFTPAINMNSQYLREFSKKFKTAPLEYLWAWGTLIHKKNLSSKISCQTPFKRRKVIDTLITRFFPCLSVKSTANIDNFIRARTVFASQTQSKCVIHCVYFSSGLCVEFTLEEW
jgi:hypothetical protein